MKLQILSKFDPSMSISSTCDNDGEDSYSSVEEEEEYRGVKRVHDRILVVHNEELYDKPQQVLKIVLKFANLDPTCLHDKKERTEKSSDSSDSDEKKKHLNGGNSNKEDDVNDKILKQFTSTFEEPYAKILRETQEAAGGKGKLSAFEYAKKRCANSAIDPEFIQKVYRGSIDKFKLMFDGTDFGWDDVV